ncbi:YolD-like family protein [Pseudogracilibacillus sp. SE30717A]|uniref:YolD-like family protein n=1 Tax=Pseudogracilibacillus sp. SE30717A TaxID=3098293 RepID=UPI00300E15F9
MKVNDRGTIKWTALMLPEHVEMLNKMWEEQEYKYMPELDEQQIAENSFLLQEALANDLEIKIKYYKDHDHKIIVGYLLHVDILNKKLYLKDIEIKIENIIEVTIL